MRPRASFFLLFFGSWGIAAALRSGKYCFEGCQYSLNCIDFNDTSPALSRKVRACQSVLRAKSLYLCLEEYCTDEGRTEWLTGYNETCQTSTKSLLPPYNIIVDHAPGYMDGVRRLRADEGMCGREPMETLGEATIPDRSFFERAFRTLEAAFFEEDMHWLYGMTMYYFWAIVIFMGICARIISLIRSIQCQEWQPIPDSESNNETRNGCKDSSIRNLPYALLKRHVIIPATFGYRCSQNIGWCTVPSRIQSLTIASFVLLNIVLCSISYPVFSGNIFWPDRSTQVWRYVSDRTGIISMANLPLIWLFGTRNNTLIWLTGWGFGTYNNFHRWVARVATVQAVIHSIGYTQMVSERGGWHSFIKYLYKRYFWNGELATIFMCAICAFSVYGLRRSHYEIFLATHIILSIGVLVTMYYHVEIFNGEWNIFLWPSLIIWVFDRLLRAVRIFAFNPRFWNTKCSATYNPSSNLVRIDIPCSQSVLKPKPGSYYYIYSLDNLRFAHQNHPFTLAYMTSSKEENETEDSDCRTLLSSHSDSHRPSPHRHSSTSTESEALLTQCPSSSIKPSSSLVFLIRPYDGFTSRLAQISASTPTPKSVRVLIEGPYGETAPLQNFPSVLFLVGGTGIAVPLSYMSRLLTSSNSHVTRLRIVWAVREHAFFVDVLEQVRDLLRDERVVMQVHVTRDEESKDDPVVEALEGVVEVLAGRPDIDATVDDLAREAGSGRIAVVACGPAQMADEARRAAVRAVGDGYGGVEYFEESFKW